MPKCRAQRFHCVRKRFRGYPLEATLFASSGAAARNPAAISRVSEAQRRGPVHEMRGSASRSRRSNAGASAPADKHRLAASIKSPYRNTGRFLSIESGEAQTGPKTGSPAIGARPRRRTGNRDPAYQPGNGDTKPSPRKFLLCHILASTPAFGISPERPRTRRRLIPVRSSLIFQ